MPADVPGAVIEETFFVDQVVAHRQADGSVHLMLYVGRTQDGSFLHLKYAVIPPHAAEGLFAPDQIGAGPAVRVPTTEELQELGVETFEDPTFV